MNKDFRDYGISVKSTAGKWSRAKCPKCPPGTKSHENDLAVNTDEEYWVCHRCGSSGSLKYGWTGDFTSVPQVEEAKPPAKPDNKEGMYLYFESRKITRDVVDRNRIQFARAYFPAIKSEKDCISFNYYIGNKLVNSKYRSIDKDFAQSKNGHKVFYKLNDIIESDEVIITEGEIDALSFEVAGFKNVISVPDGGIQPNWENIEGKMEFLKNSSEYLRHVKKFYLATDNDEVGILLQRALAQRLGKEKCYIVSFNEDCKDPNECLKNFGRASLTLAIENAKPYPVEGVHTADDFAKEVDRIYTDGYPEGPFTGIEAIDSHLKHHGSTLAVITGVPGHGKTTAVNYILNRYATRSDWKFAVFSPEHSTSSLIIMLTRQLMKKPFHKGVKNRMTHDEVKRAHKFINDHFFFIDPLSAEQETFTIDDLFDATKYLKMKYGINGLLIDSWTKIQHMVSKFESETNYVQRTLNRFSGFCKQTGLNTYLIAHPTKMESKADGTYKIPGMYDIAGSANFFNLADIGMTVYKEESANPGEFFTRIRFEKIKEDYMGKTGTANLLHDRDSLSFYDAHKSFEAESDLEYYEEFTRYKEEMDF